MPTTADLSDTPKHAIKTVCAQTGILPVTLRAWECRYKLLKPQRTSGNYSAALGDAQSAGAIGAVVGGLLVSLWGGFKRRMHSIFLGETLTAVFGLVPLGLGRSLPHWIAAAAADYVTEPAMRSQTLLASAFGGLVGNGPGSGMALQFVLAGLAYVGIVLLVFLCVPAVRNLEDRLPDHDSQRADERDASSMASAAAHE